MVKKEDKTMAVTLEAIPKTGHLQVDIKVSADVNVTAFTARQKVNNFVLSEISYMMHAGEPSLVVDERIYWRVPVILSLTSHGDVGEVGYLDVNIETGQIQISPSQIAEIEARAEGLAAHTPPKTAA
jgi:hypothetical protein